MRRRPSRYSVTWIKARFNKARGASWGSPFNEPRAVSTSARGAKATSASPRVETPKLISPMGVFFSEPVQRGDGKDLTNLKGDRRLIVCFTSSMLHIHRVYYRL